MDYFEHYKRVNDLSEKGRRSHWKPFDKTLGRFLPRSREAVIVDVGCGAGILLEWLQEKGYRNASGIDLDRGQIGFCEELGLPAEQVVDSAKWLEDHRGIDFLILKDVLEHVPEEQVRILLLAAKRSLSVGGKIYISVPNALSSFATLWRYIDGTHLRSYSENVMRLELVRAGFHVQAVLDDDTWAVSSFSGIVRLVLRTLFRCFRRLEAVGEFGSEGLRTPLGLNLIVVAAPANEQTAGR